MSFHDDKTKSGYPIRGRLDYGDKSLFTHENDHNPMVAKICPECEGVGRWSEDIGEIHGDFICVRCDGLGAIDEPEPLFQEECEIISVEVPENGFIRCPGCGKGFATYSNHTWTGRRHKCGQKIKLA